MAAESFRQAGLGVVVVSGVLFDLFFRFRAQFEPGRERDATMGMTTRGCTSIISRSAKYLHIIVRYYTQVLTGGARPLRGEIVKTELNGISSAGPRRSDRRPKATMNGANGTNLRYVRSYELWGPTED